MVCGLFIIVNGSVERIVLDRPFLDKVSSQP